MSQDTGCSSETQVGTTGRLLEVVSDHNPREMADTKSDVSLEETEPGLQVCNLTKASRKREAFGLLTLDPGALNIERCSFTALASSTFLSFHFYQKKRSKNQATRYACEYATSVTASGAQPRRKFQFKRQSK